MELIERLELRRVVLVVQDWGGLLGLTLPMEMTERFHGLLVMNTLLATGDAPLSPGLLAWREMCARNPVFDVARLFARGNPHLSTAQCAAYAAPFPENGHRAATRAFAAMVPDHPDADGAAISRQARNFWETRWSGKTLMAVGLQDPVMGAQQMGQLERTIRGCSPPVMLSESGHFVPEWGESLARMAIHFFDT